MKCGPLAAGLALGLTLAGARAPARMSMEAPERAATQWWADISALANDGMEGRLTGSSGYLKAADYVISRFKAEGLQPAGVDGYLQPIAFEQQVVDQTASHAQLESADGSSSELRLGEDALISAGGAPRPPEVSAPLVFVGYGLHIPEKQYDDLAGIDIRGKIVVVLSGGPADLSGPVKSNARFERTKLLGEMGAAGIISLTTPHQVEIPWTRQQLLAGQAGMYLADASLRDVEDGFFVASMDPAKSERLFVGSGHTFAELCALADAAQPVPRFTLPLRLTGRIAARRERLSSPNIVAKLPGRDSKLASQYVAVTAHLDHLGVGAPINGDPIYNGAMDDASGVATVLDIAHRLKRLPQRPRRSVLFVVFTAEEKGLLGSHYYARRPTVPVHSIVADLNFDMPLPLWPLTGVLAMGDGESTLGTDARVVAFDNRLTVFADPLPDRNSFIRTDQFSFVREGIPSLAFKFGFAKNTPQFQIEHDWRATRYHAPSDDLEQPGVLKDEAVKLDAYVAALALRVANADARPDWLPTSVFGAGVPR